MLTLKVSEVYSSSDNDDDSLNYSSNSSVASDVVDSIDLANELPLTVYSAKIFLVALWSKSAPPTQESEIIGNGLLEFKQLQKTNLYWIKLLKSSPALL